MQELLSERARLAAEVESLKASTAAEAVSSKAELEALRNKLEQQAAELVARTEALAAGRWGSSELGSAECCIQGLVACPDIT